jgi:metallo-beta-lactamase family protein
VRARIAQIQGFSAHADRRELLRGASGWRRTPRRTFVVHAERETAFRFAGLLAQESGGRVEVPAWRDETLLE